MPSPVRIALLGFSEFERSALVSYFQLTAQRRPSYSHVLALDDADLVVVDAEQPGTLALLQELDRNADAVFVGAHGSGDAAGWMMRPINPAHVLRELDALLVRRHGPVAGGHPSQASAHADADAFAGTQPQGLGRVADARPTPSPGGRNTRPDLLLGSMAPTLPTGLFGDPLSPGPLRTIGSAAALTAGLPAHNGRRANDRVDLATALSTQQQAAEARRRRREAALRPDVLRRALLVDDSEVALHFLRRELEPYGLVVDVARDSERALDLLSHQPYGLVFLDIDLGPQSRSDGLALCHRIRHQLLHPGGRAPVVVMVSAFHEAVDQVRGTLAGAEAFLAKPLDFAVLDGLMRRHGFSRQAPAATETTITQPLARHRV
ncbi:response regulator [Aquabacterium sp. OR-4]|uniref:response regulator n=1 Tax=Aquabacterium sp. OR-4 TaxID=2978127 RepID=UPI0021B3D71A|nr:response regulator [Aquabacterium sp. OR-4]MDT7833589.1 response regulator [Aquabacterium sp. OR-4]